MDFRIHAGLFIALIFSIFWHIPSFAGNETVLEQKATLTDKQEDALHRIEHGLEITDNELSLFLENGKVTIQLLAFVTDALQTAQKDAREAFVRFVVKLGRYEVSRLADVIHDPRISK